MVEKRSTLREVEKIEELPRSVGPTIRAIEPVAKAVRSMSSDYYYNATIENAKRTADHITKTRKLVAESVHAGRVNLIYGYYNLDTGVVDFLG